MSRRRDSLQEHADRLEHSHLTVQTELERLRAAAAGQDRLVAALRNKVVELEGPLDRKGKGKGKAAGTASTSTVALVPSELSQELSMAKASLEHRETELRQALAGWKSERDQALGIVDQLKSLQSERDVLASRNAQLVEERDVMASDWRRMAADLEAAQKALHEARGEAELTARQAHEAKMALTATKATKDSLERQLFAIRNNQPSPSEASVSTSVSGFHALPGGAGGGSSTVPNQKRKRSVAGAATGPRARTSSDEGEEERAKVATAKKEVAALLRMKQEAEQATTEAVRQREEAEQRRDRAKTEVERAMQVINTFRSSLG